MGQANLQGGTYEGFIAKQLLLKNRTATLAGTETLTTLSEPLQLLDPGGAARNVDLPAEASSDGLCFIIVNTADAAEVITVRDDAAATVATLAQNEAAMVFCDGVSWRSLVGANT